MDALIQCPKCRATLAESAFNLPSMAPCPSCESPLQVEIFPAFFRKLAPGQKAEAVMVEGESSCFYHPQKKAVRPCDGCGRFVCALCDCELSGQHFCPTCLDVGKSKGKIKTLDNHRTRYDSIALSLAIVSALLFFTFFIPAITATGALYMAIRYWKAPQSIVRWHRIWQRISTIIAIIFAVTVLVSLTLFLVAVFARRP
jgi:hypothetical protein